MGKAHLVVRAEVPDPADPGPRSITGMRPTTCLGRCGTRVCARTSRRPGCAFRCRIRADNWNPDADRPIIGRMGLTLPHEFGNVQYAV
jgi:hypothetical protein